jgi:hypothetical protein
VFYICLALFKLKDSVFIVFSKRDIRSSYPNVILDRVNPICRKVLDFTSVRLYVNSPLCRKLTKTTLKAVLRLRFMIEPSLIATSLVRRLCVIR